MFTKFNARSKWLLFPMLSIAALSAQAESPVLLSVVSNAETQEAVFTATPNLPGVSILQIKLYEVDGNDLPVNELGDLRDDGSLGDAVVNDGVYSAKIAVDPNDGTMRCRALVNVGEFPKPVYSNTVNLSAN